MIGLTQQFTLPGTLYSKKTDTEGNFSVMPRTEKPAYEYQTNKQFNATQGDIESIGLEGLWIMRLINL